MKKISKHEFVEVIIPANSTSTRINIPDQPNLRHTRLTGIQVYTEASMDESILSGETPPTAAQLKKMFLTLIDYGSFEFLKFAPMGIFQTIQNVADANIDRDFKSFKGQEVNYPKSFISLSSALGNVNDVAVVFSVYYVEPLKSDGKTFGNRT